MAGMPRRRKSKYNSYYIKLWWTKKIYIVSFRNSQRKENNVVVEEEIIYKTCILGLNCVSSSVKYTYEISKTKNKV